MTPPGRVLLVDDDDMVRTLCEHALQRAGFEVDAAADGAAALALFARHRYNAILSDIRMPGLDGIQFLGKIRALDLDIPVVLMTGSPDVDSAAQAVELGALRYLIKPVRPDTLVEVLRMATGLHHVALLKRQALELLGHTQRLVGDRAGLEACFVRALDDLNIAYQPIVSWSQRAVVAYEALMRPQEPSLPNPGALLAAAEQLDRIHALGRVVRARALRPLGGAPTEALLYLNLHPHDLLDETLYDPGTALAAAAPRIVLELTERASLSDVDAVQTRVARLRSLGYRIAIDDLGAGYAGLTTFALLEPEVVKIDMGLVRSIDASPTQRAIVEGLVAACLDLGIEVIAEGVETEAELRVLLALRIDLLQGYLFAKPGPAFPTPRFPGG